MLWFLLLLVPPAAEVVTEAQAEDDRWAAIVQRTNALTHLQTCVTASLRVLADESNVEIETASYRAMLYCNAEAIEFRARTRATVANAQDAFEFIQYNEQAIRVSSLAAVMNAKGWPLGNPEESVLAPAEKSTFLPPENFVEEATEAPAEEAEPANGRPIAQEPRR